MRTPNLEEPKEILHQRARPAPYWKTLQYCRHIGIQHFPKGQLKWMGRVRTKAGSYKQFRLGLAFGGKEPPISYSEAIDRLQAELARPEISACAADPYPIGPNQNLKYGRSVIGFTVGDALIDYGEWKRLAATKKNFQVLLSLINHHIVPSLGDVQLDDFNGPTVTEFFRSVLESAPKRGNQSQGPKRKLTDLDEDSLRKRKGTVNALAGILRCALRMAWENGNTENDRVWRCIHRLPNYEAPRQLFLTRDECRNLIGNCRPDLANLVRAALYSGCRVTELSELRCRDIGKDVFGIFVRMPKNRKSRHVFLPQEGMQFFIDQCRHKLPDDLVFRTRQGHRWNGKHKHLFKSAVCASGLPRAFVFHGLRHTYASQLVQAGTPLAVVARQLGHSNTDTVSRTYGHLSCASIEQELESRFAPLNPNLQIDSGELGSLKRSLQEHSIVARSKAWPDSNFSRFQGELLRDIR